MELNNATCKLIADLEYLIGSECFNPNSYDGYNGIEGCAFRYPVTVPDPIGIGKTKLNVSELYELAAEKLEPSTIEAMRYKFGSNELYIGRGLIKALEYLEYRYGIDFSKDPANKD